MSPGQSSIWPNGVQKHRVADTEWGDNPVADAAYIAALHNSLPQIAEYVKRLEEDLRKIRIEATRLCVYAEKISPYVVMSEAGDDLDAKLKSAARETRSALNQSE